MSEEKDIQKRTDEEPVRCTGMVRSIETAPRDGTEILMWREDAGWFLARWIAPCDFLHERELENMNDTENPDWFYADFICGGRWDGGEPTHWSPLPDAPNAAISDAADNQKTP
jgi:hypothetical protein